MVASFYDIRHCIPEPAKLISQNGDHFCKQLYVFARNEKIFSNARARKKIIIGYFTAQSLKIPKIEERPQNGKNQVKWFR